MEKKSLIFGQRLKSLRKEKGWTQEELAKKLGVSRSAVAGWESSCKDNLPEGEVLIKIATIFGVSVDYLLGRTDNPKLADDVADNKKEQQNQSSDDPIEDLLRRFENRDPDTMTVEEALEIILRAEHVMFSGVPPGREMDEDVLLDVREALVHLVKFLLKQKKMGTKIPTAGGKSGGPTAPGN